MDSLLANRDPSNQEKYLEQTNYHLFPGGRKKLAYLSRTLKELSEKEPLKILDIGCGNGSLTFPIGSLGYDIVGIDISEESVQFVKSKNSFSNVRFVCHDLMKEPLPERFNCVICSEVLEHLYKPEELLKAISQIMTPGAFLIITIPNGYGLREMGGRLEKRLRQIPSLSKLIDQARHWLGMHPETEKHQMHTSNPDQGHIQKFTPLQLRNLSQSQGFQIVEWVGSFWFLSLFGKAKTGRGWVASFDSWLADKLPLIFASGWYILCHYSDKNTEKNH